MAQVRVLIVDDQEPFRQAAAAVVDLTDPFVVVGTAESGESCLTAVRALHPDLVLMDVGLPGIDGMEATRRLSTLSRPPLVVLVSTHDEDEFGDGARSCGAVAYIKKSVFGPDPLTAAWALGSSGSTARNSTNPSEPFSSSS
ncbi:Response regulator receiver domain-containing protein [Geodermatophilus amargosae]|uniref:Response regulator receiver domain-containing protein n=1 Tax=Geodermatophilus amargosae TaxID=1296565 RepID=A0A1I7DB77_9ACTN|nr:response regulator transcription factor [Geodermatophilus amargosae]SFU08978.1 Response regulator receiver domain-containing protein [Geodermatophilus amargosae]